MNRAERLSLAGAATVHLVLLTALSLAWQNSQRMMAAPTDAVPVEIIDISDAPRTPEPPQPSMAAAPQEMAAAAPEVDAAPQPEPAPAESVPPPEPTKPVPPKPKAAPAKAPAPALDTSILTSVIDKSLPKAPKKTLDTSKLANDINAAVPARAAIDPRAAATLAQAIRAQVAPCWNPPVGGRDVRRMTVTVRVQYGRDGRVIGIPQPDTPTGTTAANADYARAFAETARRAVLRCQPLKLPAEMYDLWGNVEINFDPEEMT